MMRLKLPRPASPYCVSFGCFQRDVTMILRHIGVAYHRTHGSDRNDDSNLLQGLPLRETGVDISGSIPMCEMNVRYKVEAVSFAKSPTYNLGYGRFRRRTH
jgi:hypothetical protein